MSKLDRLARSTVDLYNIVAQLQAKGVEFKVIDDPSIDTTSRTGKLVMGILALIAEFENDIRRERQLDGIAKAKERGVRFGVQPKLTEKVVKEIGSFGALRLSPRSCVRPASARPACIGHLPPKAGSPLVRTSTKARSGSTRGGLQRGGGSPGLRWGFSLPRQWASHFRHYQRPRL